MRVALAALEVENGAHAWSVVIARKCAAIGQTEKAAQPTCSHRQAVQSLAGRAGRWCAHCQGLRRSVIYRELCLHCSFGRTSEQAESWHISSVS